MKTIKYLLMLLILGTVPGMAQETATHRDLEGEKVCYEGTVINQDGLAVEGAHVCVYRLNFDTGVIEVQHDGETDAEGRFSIMIANNRLPYCIKVSAQGYADYEMDFPIFTFGEQFIFGEENAAPEEIILFSRLDFTAGRRATLILPEAPDPTWGRFYRLDKRDVENPMIYFVREYEPKANVPYVIFPERDFSINLGNYDLNSLPEQLWYVPFPDVSEDDWRQWGFYGTYHSHYISPLAVGSQIVLDDTPDCSTGNGTKDSPARPPRIGAFRAYLQALGRSVIQYDDTIEGDLTGIVSPAITDNNKCFYDLQGRRLTAPPTKGVYVSGGRKYVVK